MRGLGCKRDTKRRQLDASLFHPKIAAKLAAGSTPLEYALDTWQPPRPDQGQTGSCTAHAAAGSFSTALRYQNQPLPWEPSEDLIYKATRCYAISLNARPGVTLPSLQDDGAESSNVMAAVGLLGVASRRALQDGRVSDVSPSDVNEEPDFDKLEEAETYLIAGSHRIQENLSTTSDVCAAAIASGFPVFVGFLVDSAFEQLSPGQVASAPNENDPNGGGHATYLSAFKRVNGQRLFTLTNSWGNSWCDNGQCLVGDAWLAKVWDLLVMDVAIMQEAA
jgi:hypothetical protein